MKSQRQQYIDIITAGSDNDEQLEFLEGLTLAELKDIAENVQVDDDL